MSVDMRHALRHAECLANPSLLHGARWAGGGCRRMCLRTSRAPRTAFAHRGEGLDEFDVFLAEAKKRRFHFEQLRRITWQIR